MKFQLLIVAVILALAAANPSREGRIVGGVDNTAGQVPWAVSVQTLQGFHFCTGSLVNNWWIITSSHCIIGRAAATIGLRLGRVTIDGTGGIVRQGFRTVTHPSYDANTQNFDVGLIQVSVIITFSTTVQSIFLAEAATGGNLPAKVSGWGSSSEDKGPTSNTLRTLDVRTITNPECRDLHDPFNAVRLTENMLCTHNTPGEGWCTTGEGGPLVWNAQLIGIASWNVPCAQGYPDVYVRVSQLRPWILSIIGTN